LYVYNINATSPGTLQEPTFSTNTSTVREQLDAVKPELPGEQLARLNLSGTDLFSEVRNLADKFSLGPVSPLPPNSAIPTMYQLTWANTTFADGINPWTMSESGMITPYPFVLFCPTCPPSSNWSLTSQLVSNIFTNTLFETGSPALAVQAVLTTAKRKSYYEWLPFLDNTDNSTTTSFKAGSLPQHVRGYWAVLAIIFTHVILCSITLCLFAGTRISFLNNAWQTMAHIYNSPEADKIMERAIVATDSEIKNWVRSEIPPVVRRFKLGAVALRNG
jgi:hypothetical protein